MPDQIDQQFRLMAIETPLGANKLTLTEVNGQEEMSKLYIYRLVCLSDDLAIDHTKIVGKKITFSVKLFDEEVRHYNGYVTSFQSTDLVDVGTEQGKLRRYTMTVEPWAWFLTRGADCRIFQEKTIPEIIESVFDECGISDYDSRLTLNHPKQDYCVQYRETNLSFVMRLMQEAGIGFHFEHTDSAHTLVMTDSNNAFQPCRDDSLIYNAGSEGDDRITSWQKGMAFPTGKYSQRSFNFQTPSTDLTTSANGLSELGDAIDYEIYDYPGEYLEKGDGQDETKLRMEAAEVEHIVVTGASTIRSLETGTTFTLSSHTVEAEENQEYLLLSVDISIEDYTMLNLPGSAQRYTNSFTCIPKSVTYRPKCTISKPFMKGPQTAIVTGSESDNEIYVDEFGRVKVHFHWDRLGQYDSKSSCWIRVSQNWAGKNWGIVFHPRVGQEVIVDFIEGDPDRPIITGRVYNAEQPLPYDCPANKTQSGIKTRSSKDGGTSNFNELRFEDKKGEEQIYLHAEKDLDSRVEHCETRQVDVNRTTTIGQDEKTTIGRDEEHTVGRHRTKTIAENESNSVGQNRDTSIGGNDTVQVGSNQTVTVGSKMVFDVGSKIELKCGASSLTMSADGTIELKGVQVKIEGATTTEVKGIKVGVQGSAMLDLKGGIVKIN